MARRTFRLIKDTDQFIEGALFQEECDDGTQNYILLNRQEYEIFNPPIGSSKIVRNRDCIENNPKWFVEVFKVLPDYATKDEIKRYKRGGK